jgi:hypothetical protein
MRQENQQRLSGIKIRSKDQYYIHLYFLLKDVKNALQKHATGSLLDIGCGNKPYQELYIPYTAKQTGCDSFKVIPTG